MSRWLPLLTLLGCAVDLEDTGSTGLTEVTWTLAWDERGVTRTEEGWCTTTDLGTRVCVTEGTLVSAMTSMVACGDVTARRSPPGLLDLLVPTAWAGHPGEADPSAWLGGRVEDLVAPADAEVGTLELFGDAYCRAHWAVDAAWEGTAGLDDDALVGTSLVLEGTFEVPGGRTTPFAIHSDLAWGELRDLEDLPSLDGAVELRVVRPLAPIFDGIDFPGGLEGADRIVLRNLANETRFEAW